MGASFKSSSISQLISMKYGTKLYKLGCFQRFCPNRGKMAKSDGALGRIRKQLRSVLISEKYGVAVDRVEMDYQELV